MSGEMLSCAQLRAASANQGVYDDKGSQSNSGSVSLVGSATGPSDTTVKYGEKA